MLDHVGFAVKDYDRSQAFDEKALAPLGLSLLMKPAGEATAVLAGSAVGLLAAIVSSHSLASALAAGGTAAVATLAALMRHQESAWKRFASTTVIAPDHS